MSEEKKTVYFIHAPVTTSGLRYELEAVPAHVTGKMVTIERCAGSKWRARLSVAECHFAAEDAIRAKEAEIEEFERKAAAMRDALVRMLRESGRAQ